MDTASETKTIRYGKPLMATGEQTASLKEILVKDMVGAHRDCPVRWRADFAEMEMELHVGFIVPSVLISFLEGLPRHDECFLKSGITGAVRICNHFRVSVWVAHGEHKEVRYRMKAYQPDVLIGGRTGPEIELTAYLNEEMTWPSGTGSRKRRQR